ncbi:MAG: DEAD/DEAH box helicase family protein [Bacteroidota bacterium]|nr:DEAD/DEAH box helicase family protein [Bacteroidota bacterium]MDP4233667.1 DEAD/DEAH box helicase family protein [Bacteroidota bacterium]MDP4243073.1 DEAD/DEAH box helicase family protein [Bacteroidota bacterium]MDP4288936.1 DEAD/DEAH box helicase family protein [Bacteroidota bacterium]
MPEPPHPVTIENPIINSPYVEPNRHFKFEDYGITDTIEDGRRTSSYFIPIAKAKKKQGSKQLILDTEWTQDRIEENKLVNDIRQRVAMWRKGGYVGVTPVTAQLIEYWTNPERDKKLFFCQNEALETAIYIAEVAKKFNDAWIENRLREANDSSNPGLPRTAFKMATGSGKTVVMAMLIAWQTLNKRANPQDARFSDTFLIVTPGITIRDRLRVLMPNDPENYYRQRDIIPAQMQDWLGQAKILITNFHAFQLKEKIAAGKITKSILSDGKPGLFTETPDQMVRRVCREFGNKKNIIVLNDEAHHCYRRRPDDEDEEKLTGDDRTEAKSREEEARIWISGIEAIQAKIGVKAIYDLSATPFFLRGSGYPEGTLFPWVASDFSLIDAIEAGIVKVPRVPVADDSMTGDQPTYRDLWLRISKDLPKKGRKTEEAGAEPNLPVELQGALHSLYGNYEKYYRLWEQNTEARARGITPPVFIVVCNNTNVSKLVFDFIAGWEKKIGEKNIVQAGQLAIFRNDDGNGGWLQRPNTILVDSHQLESGESMSEEFKNIAAREIEEFKAEYRVRFPGRDAENLTDEDLLREVMNTVGKAGKLGEHIKCVVSVSMLTEGWDANTVTHVLGVRAFGTQLLCEQVVGRALRRMSYFPNDKGHFNPEYAEVYGVPFSFIPTSGATKDPKPGPIPTRVRALEERLGCEITFPRLLGYRYDLSGEQLHATFSEESRLSLSTADIPTITENAPIVGETSIHTLEDLQRRRPNEVAFLLAKLTLEKYFRDDDGNGKPWLFPQLLAITKRWLDECVICKDNTFPQLLLLIEFAHDAADRIYKAIVASNEGTATLKPILRPYDTIGSTKYVDFDSTKPVYRTREDKCHISHVVADTDSWEQKMAQSLEDMKEVRRYVKNQSLGFTIPYTINGGGHDYNPDFIACIDDGQDDLLNLIVEVTGEKKKDKLAKVSTAKTLWIPAVNNHGGFGRWAFIEIDDPWNAKNTIREFLKKHG